MRFRHFLAALTIGALIYGCWLYYQNSQSLLKSDSPKTQAAITAVLPIGSIVSVASDLMTKEGMRCSQTYQRRFVSDRIAGNPAAGQTPTDFLWCNSEERGFMVTKRWQVIFVADQGPISTIGVSVGLTGP